MFTKIILYATHTMVIAGIWRMGKLKSYLVFQHHEQGLEDFRQFLEHHRNTKIYLIADAVEEDFRLETLPHVVGKARHEMVDRKLNQLYRGTHYRAAHFINREKEKRKDDRYLFTALNNADFLQPWIDHIAEQQAPLAGIYLLPMISQAMIRRLKLMAPNILLSERLNSGLRQTYLHNGRLRMSRLAPIPEATKNQLGYFYLVETEKTKLYLISQRYITRDTTLSMVLPALDESSEQICRGIEQEHGLECNTIDLRAFAKSQHLDPKLLETNPELMHMHLLAHGAMPDNLAPANLTKHFQIVFLRQWINVTSAAVVVGGLLLTAVYFKSGFDQSLLIDQAATA
ncbi:MAG TPA: hypothetical protein VFF74_11875, partial [Methylophilaceae bacterium]|nr:hypothetical protein [Methylophilaceae bacterium]